jgi:hypothetical protein
MVPTPWRIAEISASRINAVFVSEGAFQHEDLFSARMGMRWE